MGLFSNFMDSLLVNRVRTYARETAAVMLTSARAFGLNAGMPAGGEGIAEGALALETRPYWTKISASRFIYERSGQTIAIPDAGTLPELVSAIVETELLYMLRTSNIPPAQIEEMLIMAESEVRKAVPR